MTAGIAPWGRRWNWRASALALLVYGAFSALAEWPLWTDKGLYAFVNTLAGAVFLLTGMVLLDDPRRLHRCAIAFGVTSVFWQISWLDSWGPGLMASIAHLGNGAFWCAALFALLLYPRDRVTRGELAFVVAFGLTVTASNIYVYATDTTWDDVADIFTVYDSLVAVTLVVLLLRRYHDAHPIDRHVLRPVIASVIVAGVVAVVADRVALTGEGSSAGQIADSVALMLVPLSFLVAYLQLHIVRADVGGHVASLPADATLAEVRETLRSVLHDSTLDILDASTGRSIAEAAETVPVPRDLSDAFTVPIELEDASRALIVTRPELAHHPELVVTAAASVRLMILLQRRASEERRRLAQRTLETRREEQQRFGRSLHDRAQAPLSAARLAVGRAIDETSGDAQASEILSRAATLIDHVSDELRRIARDIYPDLLSNAGLAVAIGGLIDALHGPAVGDKRAASPGPVITTDIPRCPFGALAGEMAEYTAYCFIVEAMQNALRHAVASRVEIIAGSESGTLVVTIRDNGGGGATFDPAGGLAGLRDRCRQLDGTLELDSRVGGGTSVTAVLPIST